MATANARPSSIPEGHVSRIAYVDGRYVPHQSATVHIEDRGYQFADAVYEVVAVKDGVFVDAELHLVRLHRSLAALAIAPPMSDRALALVLHEVVRRNSVDEGIVYLQISRGAAPRDFAFPKAARPTLVVTARARALADPRVRETGVGVIAIPDIRWARPDIKSVSLLANVLGKEQAKQKGAYEAWQLDRDGFVTEGTSSNAWIVTSAGELVTRQADQSILNGVTRRGLLRIIADERIPLVERPFSLAEAKSAPEAFLTSASNFLIPVVRIDGAPIGNGRPGPITRRLADCYARYAATGGQDR
jgi:D-alanine transaminase